MTAVFDPKAKLIRLADSLRLMGAQAIAMAEALEGAEPMNVQESGDLEFSWERDLNKRVDEGCGVMEFSPRGGALTFTITGTLRVQLNDSADTERFFRSMCLKVKP